VRPKIRRLIELTGTPNPHGLMDLWSQIFLLDGGQRLGRTISVYRDMYFIPDKRNRTTIFSYAPREGAEEEIHRRIADLCVSMKASDYLTLPDLITEDIPVVLDDAAQRSYDRMERDAVLHVDEETITAANAAALSGKLLQLCNGAVYDEEREVVHVHDCKLEALLEAVEGLSGQHAIICYAFIHDRDRILQALSRTGLRVRVYTDARDGDDWNAGRIDLLLVHPASCGYGLNLQDGGHHVIWFGLTWNLEQYLQTNKRLHRQGQAYPVIVHNLIVKGGRDEDVIRSLACKDRAQEALLESLKARIASARESN
jgi:SNF2 family DNA or RNA helicase